MHVKYSYHDMRVYVSLKGNKNISAHKGSTKNPQLDG